MFGLQNIARWRLPVPLLCVALVNIAVSVAFVVPGKGLMISPSSRPCSSSRPDSSHSIVMVAKPKRGKSNKNKKSFRGFGKVPEKLIDRAPPPEELCVCQSGKTYGECCKPFHDREEWPATPLVLARSRYSAYAYRLPDWIIDSTHKSNPDWKWQRSKWLRELIGFCDGFTYEALEILEETPGAHEDEAYLEFIARLRAANAPSEAPKGVKQTLRRVKMHGASDVASADFRERSRFLREDGQWFYVSGDVDFDPEVTLERPDPVKARKAAEAEAEAEPSASADAKKKSEE